jgi:hypothetical protein
MAGMKLGGGLLIAMAIFWAALVTISARGFPWVEAAAYIWPAPIAFAFGVWMWRRKPKSWFW